MRAWAVLGVAGWISGCSPGPFVCATSEQCIDGDRGGICQPSGFCSFSDPSCPSGQRYGNHAGSGLAGRCVGEDTADDTASDVTVTTDSDTGTTPDLGTSSSSVSSSSDTWSTTGEGSSTEESEETTESEPLDPDLVAWYRFEGALDGIVEDSSGNALHGTCVACPMPTLGVVGQAAAFDGETQFIQLPGSPAFDLTEAFTVAAWAKLETWPTAPVVSTIIGRPVGDGVNNSWEIYGRLTSGVPRMHYNLSDTPSSSIGAAVEVFDASDWLHVALTWDGSTARMYLSGEVRAERSITHIAYDEQAPRIGADFDYGEDAGFLEGAIDEVRIYSRALTEEEVAALSVTGS